MERAVKNPPMRRSGMGSAQHNQSNLGAETAPEDLTAATRIVSHLIRLGADGRCDLRGAALARADLSGADFHGVRLCGANLERARFDGGCLRNANFDRCLVRSASFVGADLRGATFRGADLFTAGGDALRMSLRWVVQMNAYRDHPDLRTEFERQLLSVRTDFRHADLRGVDFSQISHWEFALVVPSIYNATTRWPDGFAPPMEIGTGSTQT
jgi:uncharacterized protein YjbI with pentapeptide repeats